MSGRHSSRWLAALLGLMVSFCAYAQTTPPTDFVTAKSVTPIGPSGGVYLGQGNFIANGKYIPAGYYKAPIKYEARTIGKLVGKALGHTLRVAVAIETIKDLYDLAQYLYNPTTQNFESGGSPAVSCDVAIDYYADIGGGWQSCGAGGAEAHLQSFKDSYCHNNTGQPYWGGTCYFAGTDWSPGTHHFQACWTPAPGYPGDPGPYCNSYVNTVSQPHAVGSPVTDPAVPGTVVPDEDVANVVWGDPQTMAGLLHDPEGNIIRTPEVKTAEDALGSQLASKYGAPSAPHTDPATDTDPSTVIVEPKTQTAPDSMPVFCEWAKTICDWIGWTKEQPTDAEKAAPSVPFEDAPTSSSTWSSGLGGGFCPAPHTVDLGDMGSFVMTVQPLCDLAEYMRPLVYALGALAAAFIIGGRRNAS